jgi:hypothetical protein
MTDELSYYTTHGSLSNPGRYAGLFDHLPDGISELCGVIQGVMIHAHWAERYGLPKEQIRGDEVQLRTLEKRLERIMELDPRPLTQPRPPERRVVGNCCDYAQMLAAILRHGGIPARSRCGFGRYFTPGHYEDHWVTQYWNAIRHRWVWVDPQIDPKQRQLLSLDWDPVDMPCDQFVTGGRAWQLGRSGAADPDRFGIFDIHGLWFIRGNLIRDVAALNRLDLLPWDCWGWMDMPIEEHTAEQLTLLDRAAALTSGEVLEFETLRKLYTNEPGLRVPARITSYVNGQPLQVRL